MVAIMPLLTLWFGYNVDARLAAIVFAGFFSFAVNASEGARNVPLESMEVARSFRARPFSTLTDVILPSSLPYLIAGLRLAAGRALVAAGSPNFHFDYGPGYFILFNRARSNAGSVRGDDRPGCGQVAFEVLTRWLTRRYFRGTGHGNAVRKTGRR
jgi:ABC-type nitrate/sulfonate/bicarbonate transport system permease component